MLRPGHVLISRICTVAVTTAIALMWSLPGLAIQPETWVHSTEADFEDGLPQGTVVTQAGDVVLAPDSQKLLALPEADALINDSQLVGDALFFAAGPSGKVYRQDGQEAVLVAEFPGEQVFTLHEHAGQLLVGVSGDGTSRVLTMDGDEPTLVVELPDARYLWDLAVQGERLLIATGSDGLVYQTSLGVAPAQAEVVLDASQDNVLVLAAADDGVVYAGTDSEGLVYRLDLEAEGGADVFVVYDAAEPEVAALLWHEGSLYVGTADAEQAKPGRLTPATDEEEGRAVPATATAPAEVEPEPEAVPAEAVNAEPVEPQAEPSEETPSTPTAANRDRLRDLLRDKLMAARESGSLDGAVATAEADDEDDQPKRRAKAARPTNKQSGNAIYRISPEGFVTELTRESVMFLDIQPMEGSLILATGAEGQVFRLDPKTGQRDVLADLDAEHVTGLIPSEQGLWMVTSLPAELHERTLTTTTRGTYTSAVLDADQVSLFGVLRLDADLPEGSSVLVQTRSGNVGDPDEAPWSKWSAEQAFNGDAALDPFAPREAPVTSPPARFLQYRFTLVASPGEESDASPTVRRMELAYVTPNLPPVVSALTAEPGKPDGKDRAILEVQWDTEDPNDDDLLFDLTASPAGSEAELQIVADTDGESYKWDTTLVPDGRYILEITAKDSPDNPPDMARTASRRSDPVVVDNTPPALLDLKQTVQGDQVTLSATATDALSPIASIRVTLQADEPALATVPTDLIFDSTREPWSVTLRGLPQGAHVATVTVTDTRGNTTKTPVLFTLTGP